MTHPLDAAAASALTIPEINLPVDTKKPRLPKATRTDAADEEIIRAADRFAAFRRRYKEGLVDATLERLIEHPDGNLTYVVRAEVWKSARTSSVADATAWAQGSTRDTNPIIAGAPLESADTIARSRALRNLGILPAPKVKKEPS